MQTLQELQTLVTEFAAANDQHDAEWIASLYAKDAEFQGAKGREEIGAWFEKAWSGQKARRRHVLTNHLLKEDGEDRARIASYEQLYLIEGEKVSLVLTGEYDIDAVREDGEWKMLVVRINLDVPYVVPDMPAMTSEKGDSGLHELTMTS